MKGIKMTWLTLTVVQILIFISGNSADLPVKVKQFGDDDGGYRAHPTRPHTSAGQTTTISSPPPPPTPPPPQVSLPPCDMTPKATPCQSIVSSNDPTSIFIQILHNAGKHLKLKIGLTLAKRLGYIPIQKTNEWKYVDRHSSLRGKGTRNRLLKLGKLLTRMIDVKRSRP